MNLNSKNKIVYLKRSMKKIVQCVTVFAIVLGLFSCSKTDEESQTPLDNTELVGKWAKIDGSFSSDSIIVEGSHLDTIKILEIRADNSLKVSRGLFCSLTTDKGKGQEGAYTYYSVNNSAIAGVSNRIKLDKCANGMPISVQGDVLKLGYTGQSDANEEYRRVQAAEPETPEEPEVPEEPIDPGTGE